MTHVTDNSAEQDMISLVRCAVNNEIPNTFMVQDMDLEAVFAAAERHSLKAAVAMALESAGVKNKMTSTAIMLSLKTAALFELDKKAVLEKLEAQGIWYMPMKGLVLKDLYPKQGMRQMADHDILFDASRENDVKTIMESCGFKTISFGMGPHDTYTKPPVSNFEMHLMPFEKKDELFCQYYQNIRQRLLKDDNNNFGYHFSPEDFYIYITAHEYKHFIEEGTGIRSLLDVYVYLSRFGGQLNMEYVQNETAKLGIRDFEDENRNLALNVFGNCTRTAGHEGMLDYLLSSGTFGIMEQKVTNNLHKNGKGIKGRLKYIYRRLFPPVSILESTYPLLGSHKSLAPFFAIHRIFKAVLFHKRRIMKEISIMMKKTKHQMPTAMDSFRKENMHR